MNSGGNERYERDLQVGPTSHAAVLKQRLLHPRQRHMKLLARLVRRLPYRLSQRQVQRHLQGHLRGHVHRFLQRHAHSARELLRISQRRWYLVAPVLIIWALAYLRLFLDPTPRLPVLFNWTPSLPYHVAWVRRSARIPIRGDFIVFAFAGGEWSARDARRSADDRGAQRGQGDLGAKGDFGAVGDLGDQGDQSDRSDTPGQPRDRYPGLHGQPFFKRVVGVPGDLITVQDRLVLVNGEPMGIAKTRTHDRRPLTPIAPQVIPQGQFFVHGASDDSFDSRYRESGLVKQEQVVALVQPLF